MAGIDRTKMGQQPVDSLMGASHRWKTTLVNVGSTIEQVIRSLDRSGLQIALITSQDDVLVGTVTDGDIRRGLLRQLTLDSPIDTIVQRTPLVVPPEVAREIVLQIMQANRLNQIPVVDDGGRVVGLHLWDELLAPVRRDNLMVIMAGGKGRRLRPYTQNCPKPLLPVQGKPILEHIVERARTEGFERFALAIHYLGHMVEEYFGDGSRFDVQISYLREEVPLGTAGAIGLLSPLPDEPFVVSNGDVLTEVRYGDLLEFHKRHRAIATMAVRLHEWQHPFGVVQTQGVEIVGFEEKPIARSYVNAGVYVLEPEALSVLNAGDHCDMPTLFDRLREQGNRVIVYPMHEQWLDVGRIEDLERARTGEHKI